MAALYTPAAIATLHSVMENPGEPAAARVAAAKELLDRAHGKPAQQVAMQADVHTTPQPRIVVVTARAADADRPPQSEKVAEPATVRVRDSSGAEHVINEGDFDPQKHRLADQADAVAGGLRGYSVRGI